MRALLIHAPCARSCGRSYFGARGARISGDEKPPGLFDGEADAHARRDGDRSDLETVVDDLELGTAQARAVMRELDAERATELARAGREIDRTKRLGARSAAALAQTAHALETAHGLKRADQDGAGLALRFGDEVQHLISPIDEINVSDARLPKHDRSPGRFSFSRMRSLVVRAIGLGLDDASRRHATRRADHQDLAEHLASHRQRVALVESARKDLGVFDRISRRQGAP
jgi:hypothetical protein